MVFETELIFVVITSCWWRGCGVICCWWPRPNTAPFWCHGEAAIRLQSPSSQPFNPLPYRGSNGACTRTLHGCIFRRIDPRAGAQPSNMNG